MNKVLYAKEGAKNMMDNMFYYFPWEVKLEIDGSNIDIPQVKCIFLPFLFYVS
jgi:diacylglycerol kinase (ATP)